MIDWDKLAAEQPPMKHLEHCVCTRHTNGYVLDYDCGRELAQERGTR